MQQKFSQQAEGLKKVRMEKRNWEQKRRVVGNDDAASLPWNRVDTEKAMEALNSWEVLADADNVSNFSLRQFSDINREKKKKK